MCVRIRTFPAFSFSHACKHTRRFMPDVPDAERHTDNKKYIETAFGVLCNTPLLSNHTASWEMLVSKKRIHEYNTEGNLTAHIPVHSNKFAFICISAILFMCAPFDYLGFSSNSSYIGRWCGIIASIFGDSCRS